MDLAHQFRTLGFGRSVQASRNASSNTAVVTGKAEVGLFGVKLMYNALLVEVRPLIPRKSAPERSGRSTAAVILYSKHALAGAPACATFARTDAELP